ncbi:hypothetical protein [Methylobacterium brachiatum]|uniref:hypothetical protein n=1 Tax=Methylobacterium brachiatum TaxID=269660 RepID=UPI0011136FDD|nr:hypothetical protein [Methylobacterium brachiatum]
MSLYGDIAMFWRFAPRLRPEIRGKIAKSEVNEALEEIDSIARHTKNNDLKEKCEKLLLDQAKIIENDLSIEPFYDDMPTGCLVGGDIPEWYDQQRWPELRGKRANAEK